MVKRLGSHEYEGETPADGIDWHIRKETQWIATVFNANEQDADKAYLNSDSFKTLGEALAFVGQKRVKGE